MLSFEVRLYGFKANNHDWWFFSIFISFIELL